MDSITHKTISPWAIVAIALFVAAYFPVFDILVGKWSKSEEYSHAFLMLPIILYMGWKKKALLLDAPKHFSVLGLLLVLFSMALYFFALLTQVHTIIALSMALTVLGSLIYLFGVQVIVVLFTPLLLFFLLIPVPEPLYIKLTFPLQLKVSQASDFIVGLFGVPIFRQGNVMNIPGKSFEVVEACSGLRSMITLLNLAIVMGYFMLKRNLSKTILVLASIPIAVFVNIIRVSVMILLYHYFRWDLTEGTLHTMTGLGVFVLAFITLLGLNKLLETWENK